MPDRTYRVTTPTDGPQEQAEAVQPGQPAGPLDDRMKHVRQGRLEASAQIARTLRVWRKVNESGQVAKPDAKNENEAEDQDSAEGTDKTETSEKEAGANEKG